MRYVASTFQHVKCKWMETGEKGRNISNVNRMRNRCGDPRRRVKRGNNTSEHHDVQRCVKKKRSVMSKVSFRKMKIILNQDAYARTRRLSCFQITVPTVPERYYTLLFYPFPHCTFLVNSWARSSSLYGKFITERTQEKQRT